ncbi:Phosphorylated carbohydrates phosphatase [Hartmannibacter diazotrophicus]|uniref:Phosphorylated carbohydrates phosphatase n=1 Tax=Hartmannibacter diazotrophicus TaxID=1482074 RepID=A0A2C9D1Y5_9HYPH|nr:HAD family phosphatase [Hartmannibacter diazotrophicus]SON54233.1 Phosphorylated carbohydrates phosphatase [Hartmannibacter diazotrophicus]
MSTPDIKAVIFDMDGCLVDSEPLALEAVAAEMRASGLHGATAEEVGSQYLGVSVNEICRDVGVRLGGAYPEGFVERVEDRLFRAYDAGLDRIEGAADLLDQLEDEEIRFAIASGSSVRRLAKTLQAAGLSSYFTGRGFSADQVARGKPAPDLFLLAAERLGTEPAQCAVLEDSPHGIRGALAAGMHAVGFVGGSHLKGREAAHAEILRQAGAAEVIDDLSKAYRALVRCRAGG